MTGRNPDGTEDFPSPGCSDVAYGPQRLNAIIGAYEAFLDRVCGTDDLSSRTVLIAVAGSWLARTWADPGGGDARWVTASGPWPPGTARPACRRARPSIRTVVSAARPVRRRRCRTLSPSAQQRG